MLKYYVAGLLLGLVACKHPNELYDAIEIIAKYQTLDEQISPNHSKCDDSVKEFNKMNTYACSFRLHQFEFDIESKFLLNADGDVESYWRYLSEGPVVYEHDWKDDSKLVESIGGCERNIRLHNDKQIIDGVDTFSIEKVFKNYQLIMVEKNASMLRGRRVFYQYQKN